MEAKIKLFRDSSCTNEIQQTNGVYQLNTSLLATSTYTANQSMYLKNVGDHKAYNITLISAGDTPIGAITLPSIELSQGAIMKCDIPININEGSDFHGTVNITMTYDNLM